MTDPRKETNTMTAFAPTHEIHVVNANGTTETIRVQDSDGVLYTREEWDGDSGADWSFDDGELLFQGQPAGMYAAGGGTVEIKRLTPAAIAAFVGEVWGKELVDDGADRDDWSDTDRAVNDLKACDFDALYSALEAAGYKKAARRADIDDLEMACARAAVAYVQRTLAAGRTTLGAAVRTLTQPYRAEVVYSDGASDYDADNLADWADEQGDDGKDYTVRGDSVREVVRGHVQAAPVVRVKTMTAWADDGTQTGDDEWADEAAWRAWATAL